LFSYLAYAHDVVDKELFKIGQKTKPPAPNKRNLNIIYYLGNNNYNKSYGSCTLKV